MINKHMPGIFGLRLGLILEPVAAQECLWCAYPFDAGSNGPMPCRPGQAYSPDRFGEMMRQPQGHSSGVSDVYNEVVLHDDSAHHEQSSGCYSRALPDIVQAFFIRGDWQKGKEDAVRRAQIHLQRFVEHFKVPQSSAPLLLQYIPGSGFEHVER